MLTDSESNFISEHVLVSKGLAWPSGTFSHSVLMTSWMVTRLLCSEQGKVLCTEMAFACLPNVLSASTTLTLRHLQSYRSNTCSSLTFYWQLAAVSYIVNFSQCIAFWPCQTGLMACL